MATTRVEPVDMKLEVVVLGVSDVDRAKAFYGNLGWRLDADFVKGDNFRVVQPTADRTLICCKTTGLARPKEPWPITCSIFCSLMVRICASYSLDPTLQTRDELELEW
jgi:hypothetical protein